MLIRPQLKNCVWQISFHILFSLAIWHNQYTINTLWFINAYSQHTTSELDDKSRPNWVVTVHQCTNKSTHLGDRSWFTLDSLLINVLCLTCIQKPDLFWLSLHVPHWDLMCFFLLLRNVCIAGVELFHLKTTFAMKAYNKLLHNLKENFYNEGLQQTIAQLLT